MTGSSKTTIMLEFLSRGADFPGDDRVMTGESGELALCPRWIHVLEYNWSLLPELFERAFPDKNERRENERCLSKCRKGLTMHGGNPVTRCLKQYYASRYSYDVRCRPELMFPHSKVVLKSSVN